MNGSTTGSGATRPAGRQGPGSRGTQAPKRGVGIAGLQAGLTGRRSLLVSVGHRVSWRSLRIDRGRRSPSIVAASCQAKMMERCVDTGPRRHRCQPARVSAPAPWAPYPAPAGTRWQHLPHRAERPRGRAGDRPTSLQLARRFARPELPPDRHAQEQRPSVHPSCSEAPTSGGVSTKTPWPVAVAHQRCSESSPGGLA
jgi:hypothetical protein